MPIRQVQWTTSKKLTCNGCNLPETPASVIVCVPSEKIDHFLCPIQPVVLPEITATGNPQSTINADLVAIITTKNDCGLNVYRYTISYDDTQLVDAAILYPQDISDILCRDCLTTYIDQQAGSEVKIELISGDSGGSVYHLTSQHGCVFEFSAGFPWMFEADTGTNPQTVGGTIVQFVGGDSITTEAATPDILRIHLDLSSNAGNIARFGTDGKLYVPTPPTPPSPCASAPGIWGTGDLAYVCPSTSGSPVYCDSFNQLRAIPQVYMVCASAAALGSGGNPPPVSVVINNPSNCRTMRVTGGYLMAMSYVCNGNASAGPTVTLAIDGGAPVAIAQMVGTTSAGVTLSGTFLTSNFLDDQFTIAAGGSGGKIFDYGTIGNAGSTLGAFAVSVQACGFAI